LAVANIGLGDLDKAFEWLNKAVDAYDFLVCYIQVVPTYNPLREDPRYNPLLGRLGLMSFADTATMSIHV
jgi:serine/threonine-protein kinase